MNFTKAELEAQESIEFYTESNANFDSSTLEIRFGQLSTWDNPYKLFVDYQLIATYKTFKSLQNRAEKLIAESNFEKVVA